MDLFSILEEQASFAFTGKVNLLKSVNKQLLGVIHLVDGVIVSALYGEYFGEKAITSIIVDSAKDGYLDFVIEPEIVPEEKRVMSLPIPILKNEAKSIMAKHLQALRLKPPMHLLLSVKSDFIRKGSAVDKNEFEILHLLGSRKISVEQVYKESPLSESLTTMALVSLRQKLAINVV